LNNDMIGEFESYGNANDTWDALRQKIDATSLTRLRGLTMKFDSFKKDPKHTMKKNLRLMSSMIRELRVANHVLIDEQQVQAVIRSLPKHWEHMRANMTHNESVKTFDNITRHLELEDERLMADCSNRTLYVAESNSRAAT
ncbi:UBN2_2 domain-containing protein, partial [Cephalotus follicularis]